MVKKYVVNNNNTIIAKREHNKLDYYLRTHAGDELYLFTREYSATCYEMCKSGAPIHLILYRRKKYGIHEFIKVLKFPDAVFRRVL